MKFKLESKIKRNSCDLGLPVKELTQEVNFKVANEIIKELGPSQLDFRIADAMIHDNIDLITGE